MYFERCTCCYPKKIFYDMSNLKRIFLNSIQAVHGGKLVRENVKLNRDKLTICGRNYSLKSNFYLVGFGKGVFNMAVELESILGSNLAKGICIIPEGTLSFDENLKMAKRSQIKFIEAAKDGLPDTNSADAAEEILNLAESLGKDDLLIVLISGGGSALLPLPLSTIKLEEVKKLIEQLTEKGADRHEINSVLKRISQVKGGGLARKTFPGYIVSLIISDIIGDDRYCIASGPTLPNKDLQDDALEVIKKYELVENISGAVMDALESPMYEEPMIPLNPLGEYFHVENNIIGNSRIAVEAAKQNAIRRGYQVVVISLSVSGEVEDVSLAYTQLIEDIENYLIGFTAASYLKTKYSKPNTLGITDSVIEEILAIDFTTDRGVCLIAAGMPTFKDCSKGKGGRNQHLALQFASDLFGLRECDGYLQKINICFLCCGSDGTDGCTDAAGAIATSNLYRSALDDGLFPTKFLKNYNAYTFFESFRDGSHLIKTGYTGAKVMDLHLMIINKSYIFGHGNVATDLCKIL